MLARKTLARSLILAAGLLLLAVMLVSAIRPHPVQPVTLRGDLDLSTGRVSHIRLSLAGKVHDCETLKADLWCEGIAR